LNTRANLASPAALAAIAAAMALAIFWPVVFFSGLALQDVPNHLARAYILLHPHDPVLLKNYRIVWSIIPDLGWDLWALAFGGLFGIVGAAKLLIGVALVLGISGCLVMGRAISGRWSPLPLIAAPFLINGAYAKGFLAFDLGFSLSFWAIAWWAWADEALWIRRLVVATVFATTLYIVHFYSFAIYGLFVLGYEIERILAVPSEKRVQRTLVLLRDGLQAAPAALLLLYSVHGSAPSSLGFVHDPLQRFGNLALLIDSGYPWSDAVLVVLYVGVLVAALALGWIRLKPGTRAVLILCLIAFLLLPDGVINTTYIAWRAMLLFVFVGIASFELTASTPQRLVPALLGTALLICLGVNAVESASWRQSAVEKERFLSAIAGIPDGSRIFFAHAGISEAEMVSSADGAYHVDAFAVIAKRALVQPMFVYPGQQVLMFADPVIQATPGNSETFLPTIARKFRDAHLDFPAYLKHFDYVVLHGSDPSLEAQMFPVKQWRLAGSVANYRLYRLP
jgi:hypothetical protein